MSDPTAVETFVEAGARHGLRASAVFPAFGDFTGLWPVPPAVGDRLFVVAGDEVIERVAG